MRRYLGLLFVVGSVALGSPGFRTFVPDRPQSLPLPGRDTDPALFRMLNQGVPAADECGGWLRGSRGEIFSFSVAPGDLRCTRTNGTIVLSNSTTGNAHPAVESTGYLSEIGGTNRVIRSAQFDNAAWTCTDVTVTADNALAPDGTMTADTLTSTEDGAYCESTAFVMSGTRGSMGVYAWTTSGTQAMAIALRDTTAGADRCTATPTADTAGFDRQKCGAASGLTGANNHVLRIYPGGTAGQGTIVVWGAQAEALTQVTSYIPTTTASATRASTNGQFDGTWTLGVTPSFSAKFIPGQPDGVIRGLVNSVNASLNKEWGFYITASGLIECNFFNTTTTLGGQSSNTVTVNATNTASCNYDGSRFRVCLNGTCANTSRTLSNTTNTIESFRIGKTTTTANYLKGTIEKICIDDSPTTCTEPN